MTRQTVRAHLSSRKRWRIDLAPYTLIAPALILLFLMALYPLIFELFLSFHLFDAPQLRQGPVFIGLDNYIRIFSDEVMQKTFLVTFTIVAIAVTAEFFLGLAIALLFASEIRGRSIVRSLILAPMILAPIATGYTWKFLLAPRGAVNYYLSFFGLQQHDWLNHPVLALPTVIFIDIWQWTPFTFLILFASIQSLPRDFIEAGMIDGASARQRLQHLIMPMLKPIVFLTIMFRLVHAFQLFDVVYVTTKGGPGLTTQVVSMTLYYYVRFIRLGYDAAAAQIFFVVVLIPVMILISLMSRARAGR